MGTRLISAVIVSALLVMSLPHPLLADKAPRASDTSFSCQVIPPGLADFAHPSFSPLATLRQWKRQTSPASPQGKYDLTFFLSGSFLGNLGMGVQQVAQAWLIAELTRSAFWLGLDAAVGMVAFLAFSTLGGVIADRWGRTELIWVQGFRVAPPLALSVLYGTHTLQVWHIIVLSFVAGIGQAVSFPLYQKVMGGLLNGSDRARGVGLNLLQTNLGRTLGPAVGAWMLLHVGLTLCFFANAVGLSIFAVAVLTLRSPKDPPAKKGGPVVLEMRQSLKERREALREDRPIWILFVLMGMASVWAYPIVTLMPIFVQQVLHQSALWLGILGGLFHLGATFSSAIWIWRVPSTEKSKYFLSWMLILSATLIAFSFTQAPATAAFVVFGAGFAYARLTSIITGLVQTTITAEFHGRAFSAFYFFLYGGLAVGSLISGSIARLIGTPPTIFGLGITLGLIAFFALRKNPGLQIPHASGRWALSSELLAAA